MDFYGKITISLCPAFRGMEKQQVQVQLQTEGSNYSHFGTTWKDVLFV